MFNNDEDRRLADYVFKGCAESIERQARQNDLRYSYAEMMAANRWVNRDMDGLVNAVVAALPALESRLARAGSRLADWIDNAIGMMVDGHFAGIVLKSAAADKLDRQIIDEMRREANAFIDICNDRGGYGGGGGYGGRDDRGGYSRGASDIGAVGNNYGVGRGNQNDRTGLDDGWSAIANAKASLNEPVRDDREPVHREPAPREEHHTTAPLVYREPEPVKSTIEGPDYTKADPWKDFWQDGEHWQVAHHTTWKLTEMLDGQRRTGIELVPKYYDINTHLKYYVMNQSGEVREELIKVNDDNRYQAHQLLASQDDEFKPPVRSAAVSLRPRPKQQTDDDMPLDAMDMDEPVPDLVTILASIDEEQMVPTEEPVLITDSMPAAVFSVRAKMVKENAPARVELSVMRTPVLLKSAGQVELVNRIYESPTMLAAADSMNELKHQFEPNLWHILNGRITDKLQHATKYAFQYDGLKPAVNFADHFGKIISHVGNVVSQEWAAAYAGRVKYVLAAACSHLSQEDISDGLSGLSDPAGINAIVFADYQVVISLDYTLDQLGLGKSLTGNSMGLAVTPTGHPKLHSSLLRVYKKLDDVYSAIQVRVVLSTSDNRLVEIVPYSARTSSFVLALLS